MAFEIPITQQVRLAVNYLRFVTRQQRLRTDEKVIAETVYGKVKGVKWRSVYGSTYYSFEGIPFAKPPLGELRFKAPLEPDPWMGIKRCTRIKSKPCQYNIVIKQMQGREDCLYLNVYTRELNPLKPLPVLVWIYGGGFQMGEASRNLYSPDYIMMENVVLVNISYRLGALGFLCLDDPNCEVPGNAGLKDQLLALKWVKANCHFFGGDPNNITVFGESAGGASTHYMMLTEKAKGLFHKAVIMSGSALASWANVSKMEWAYRLAKGTGYKGLNEDYLVLQHLRNVKPQTILKKADEMLTLEERHQRKFMYTFGPCVEPYETADCIVPKPPLHMLRDAWSNEIPLLIGGNSFEGLLMFTEARKYPDLINNLVFENLPPHDAALSEEKCREYAQVIKEVYFGDKEPSWKTILQYSDIFSYKYFWHAIHRVILARQRYAPQADTYLYRFDFDSKHFNLMRIISCGRKIRGTCHADDLSYLFYHAGAKKLKHRTAEFKTIRRMVAILAQFAKCGDPNIPNDNNTLINCALELELSKDNSDDHHHYPHQRNEEDFCAENRSSGIDITTDGHGADGDAAHNDCVSDILPDTVNIIDVDNSSASGNEQQHKKKQHQQQYHWLPISPDDATFKCLNISDELEVIDLPETEKLQLWDNMYEDKSLLF
uniref:Carboxylic ester hydrolase n=1 Tax=Glossina brevipalpis TaxID=37001 RepID=A0A1A9W1E0_9MUSC